MRPAVRYKNQKGVGSESSVKRHLYPPSPERCWSFAKALLYMVVVVVVVNGKLQDVNRVL